MDGENLILNSWLQQRDVFIKNLITSRKRPTKDSVHDLRVAIKKMRSYLRLNEEFTKEDWRNAFTETRDLFRSFGTLRDFDMSLELCRKHERKWQLSLPAFKEYLCVNRALSRRWAKQAANKFNEQQSLFEFQFKFFSGLTIAETCEKIIDLSNNKIKKAKRLKKHFEKNTHEIRKQLKDVLYWLKICPKEYLERFIDVKHLDTSLKYLGSWQDEFILQGKMKQYSRELANKKEKEAVVEMKKKTRDLQKELLEKAGKKLIQIENKKAATVKQSLVLSAPGPG